MKREVSIYWKSALLWIFVKFNYSNEINKGFRLNEDVVSVIKSFIPYSIKLEQLRVRYTNQFLMDGLMKKKQVTLKRIINLAINRKYMREFQLCCYIKYLNISGKKSEQTNNIIDYFSKIEKKIKTSEFVLPIGKYDKKVLQKNREDYCKKLCDILLLLVAIIKSPNSKKINIRKNVKSEI